MRRDHPVETSLLPRAKGGGWLAIVPDLPGCMSDGETAAEARANAADAIDCWIATARRMGREAPEPTDPDARRAR